MAHVLDNARRDGLSPEQSYAFGHRHTWPRRIRELAIWVISISAFLCGSVAILTLFGTETKISSLAERTQRLGNLISRTDEIDERVERLTKKSDQLEQRQADTDAHLSQLDHVEIAVTNLSRQIESMATELKTTRTILGERINTTEDRISLMELRLSASEENSHVAVRPEKAEDSRSVDAVQAQSLTQRRRTISSFALVRLSGDSAVIAYPQGWLRVEIGSQLPGGATILEIGRRNNHAYVLTDQGLITKAR